jgi:hypothetical protein
MVALEEATRGGWWWGWWGYCPDFPFSHATELTALASKVATPAMLSHIPGQWSHVNTFIFVILDEAVPVAMCSTQ